MEEIPILTKWIKFFNSKIGRKDGNAIRYHYSSCELIVSYLVKYWGQIESTLLTQSWTITLRKLAAKVSVVGQGQQSSPIFKITSNAHWRRCHYSKSKVWIALLITARQGVWLWDLQKPEGMSSLWWILRLSFQFVKQWNLTGLHLCGAL